MWFLWLQWSYIFSCNLEYILVWMLLLNQDLFMKMFICRFQGQICAYTRLVNETHCLSVFWDNKIRHFKECFHCFRDNHNSHLGPKSHWLYYMGKTETFFWISWFRVLHGMTWGWVDDDIISIFSDLNMKEKMVSGSVPLSVFS